MTQAFLPQVAVAMFTASKVKEKPVPVLNSGAEQKHVNFTATPIFIYTL
ncbi:MAG: hypothetical protein H6574_24315 [Lewinellaceae bacterium]|nr:hypothetical protein [Saprospiraceae bacterium]MCB9314690.1 hypothetical protein [Lewinellaceae bacterium]MCB9334185.1 hypothetical protein [Lewinellaceae bacterium]